MTILDQATHYTTQQVQKELAKYNIFSYAVPTLGLGMFQFLIKEGLLEGTALTPELKELINREAAFAIGDFTLTGEAENRGYHYDITTVFSEPTYANYYTVSVRYTPKYSISTLC